MQNVLTMQTSKYSIRIDNFEGPLDLLCHLIDVNKMDIYDVNLNEITDQYLEYIKAMQEMDLEVTSEFLLMASTLLLIKSKKLLPRQESEEEEGNGDESNPVSDSEPEDEPAASAPEPEMPAASSPAPEKQEEAPMTETANELFNSINQHQTQNMLDGDDNKDS